MKQSQLEELLANFDASFELLKGMIERHNFQNVGPVRVIWRGYDMIEFDNDGWAIASITANGFNVDLDSLTANEVECISDLMKIMQKIEPIKNFNKQEINNMDNYNDIFTNQDLNETVNDLYDTTDMDDIAYLIK